MKQTSAGKASAVSAHLQVQGSSATTDSGNYAYSADRYRSGRPHQRAVGGSVGSTAYTSGYEHCG